MKNTFTMIGTIFLTMNILAQSPQKMSYQAIVRNGDGNLVINPVKLYCQIYDYEGELIINQNIISEKMSVSIGNLPSATYYLKVVNNGFLLKTFKIIKN